jgi:hypothetical protein
MKSLESGSCTAAIVVGRWQGLWVLRNGSALLSGRDGTKGGRWRRCGLLKIDH